MSLATRCTACGTVFRVVQDQLKVSEGWVRCGRCEQVFNALEGLFDLERDTPPGAAGAQFERESQGAAKPPAASLAPSDDTATPPSGQPQDEEHARDDASIASFDEMPEAGDSPASAPPEDESAQQHPTYLSAYRHAERDDARDEPRDPHLVERIDAHLFGSRRHEPHTTPAALVAERDRHEFSDARFDADVLDDDEARDASASQPDADGAADDAGASAAAAAETAAPEFLRQAQRRARWQQPRVRLALGAAGVLLALALGLQVVHHFRDTAAARWPSLQPALAAWCAIAGCRIEPPRRIEDIVVDATALARLGTNDQAFRLSLTLHNRGRLALALPSVELSLTDGSGQLLARRVLAPRDFHVAAATLLPGGGELTLQTPLSVGALPVSGYTVEVFYP